MKVYVAQYRYQDEPLIGIYSTYDSAFKACLGDFKKYGTYEEVYEKAKGCAIEGSNIDRIILEDAGYLIEAYEVM